MFDSEVCRGYGKLARGNWSGIFEPHFPKYHIPNTKFGIWYLVWYLVFCIFERLQYWSDPKSTNTQTQIVQTHFVFVMTYRYKTQKSQIWLSLFRPSRQFLRKLLRRKIKCATSTFNPSHHKFSPHVNVNQSE